jgi:hypothetical protein
MITANRKRRWTGEDGHDLRIRSATSVGVVFDIENPSPIRYLTIPVFQPVEVQSNRYLEQQAGDIWRYFGIARTLGKAGSLITGA